MSINLTKQDANVGKVIFQWVVKEYEKHERDRRWYIFMAVVGTLLVIFGLWTANYLFILIVVLFGIILFLHGIQEPLEVNFAVTETGIVLGNKYYRFSELNSFWLIYSPPEVKNLYFSLDSFVNHRLQVPLLDSDPRPLRDYLNQYLEEDLEQEEEPLADRFARLFKLS